MWGYFNFDQILPPKIRRPLSRSKKLSRRGEDESNKPKNLSTIRRYHTIIKCRKCNQVGHNARTCGRPTNVAASSSAVALIPAATSPSLAAVVPVVSSSSAAAASSSSLPVAAIPVPVVVPGKKIAEQGNLYQAQPSRSLRLRSAMFLAPRIANKGQVSASITRKGGLLVVGGRH
ncbi:uncharacterized protein [Typha angustifolia]|uniref:uncharacterized protein n=1 Tax=Typha angustifolia TaxID=59011 RepID=UPI003C2CE8E3